MTNLTTVNEKTYLIAYMYDEDGSVYEDTVTEGELQCMIDDGDTVIINQQLLNESI